MATITFFILIKGTKGAMFMPPETSLWIKSNTLFIMLLIFIVSMIILQMLISFFHKEIKDYQYIVDQYQYMKDVADNINMEQISRIKDESSKTRLSILFYAIVGNCLMLLKQNIKLLEIFNESFKLDEHLVESYPDIDSN